MPPVLAAASAADPRWVLYPGPLVILLPITIAYLRRWKAVGASVGRLVLFMAGITVASLAFFSPLDTWGDQVLAAHMIQHLMLLDFAPILCFMGLTKAIFRPVTKQVVRAERAVPWLFSPKLGVGGYVVGMWFWHWPTMYDLAVKHSGIHVLEHLTFTIIGGVYWWHLISPIRDTRRLSGIGAVVYMAGTKIFVGILGLALTFIPHAIYPVYAAIHRNPWGYAPLEDQSLAGVIMATEQSIVMGLTLVWLVTQAIDRSEKELVRKERIEDRARAERAAAAAAAGVAPPRELY